MSYIYKCDVCGKDSAMTGVTFSPEDLEIEINAYNDAKMKIKLTIMVEDLIDSENIQKMETMINTLIQQKMATGDLYEQIENRDEEELNPDERDNLSNEIYQEVVFENLDMFKNEFKDKLMFIGNALALRLNTPNVLICDRCKRELAYKVLTEGKVPKKPDTLKYMYATESMRIQPLGVSEKEKKSEDDAIVVIQRGSWFELPDGKRVRKKDLPENIIIKKDDEDENS